MTTRRSLVRAVGAGALATLGAALPSLSPAAQERIGVLISVS